ncbi:MAG TPA: FMN-binding glutamate synthase family protein [Thermoplasmata archaeon]|nr:FMN-binding glutamate synthase family protein [Thermoplasmata archaeon]
MAGIYENARSTTGTTTRLKDINPTSGMCPICIRECPVMCEISKSAFRGREVLYPSPENFGDSTASSNKDYLLDWSHFQIMVEVRGAKGIEAEPDKAIFSNVDVSSTAAGIDLKIPLLIPGLGSTYVAKKNWRGLAVGAALSGVIQIVGENVCGMDDRSVYENGKVQSSEDMRFRIETYREYWDGKHGDIGVQTNVEDQRGGVDQYVLSKLEVNIIERKWGQGAKAIGGEVRIHNLEKAIRLKKRGYIVHPDPEDPSVQKAFKEGAFKTFERHSRVGFPEFKGFVEDIEWLRDQGAKKVFLKTGAYRPEVVAFTFKCASEAKIDLLTFDGAGGGTGMSPVPMMNEASTPTVYLMAQVLECAKILKEKGRHVPDIAFAGGFVNETQMFKALAISNITGEGPLVRAIGMARSPLTAAMKADYFVELYEKGKLPPKFTQLYGEKPTQFFIEAENLIEEYGSDVGTKIPWASVGVYTYFQRLKVGLQQLMAGSRKWNIDALDRGDIASLTEKAKKVTGIPLVEEIEKEKMLAMLDW